MLYFLEDLIYLLPSAFILFWIREILRTWLFYHFSIDRNRQFVHRSLIYIDSVSVGLMSFGGLGWGGILSKKRRDNWNTFIFSQIIYLLLFFFIYVYFRLNNTQEDTYIFQLLSNMAMMSYTLFILNWIPLPPFDFSYWYIQNRLDISPIRFIVFCSKIVVILLFFVSNFNKDFLFYDIVYNFLLQKT